MEALERVGIDSKAYGLHSLRSVGTKAAAGKNASECLIEIHERWNTA